MVGVLHYASVGANQVSVLSSTLHDATGTNRACQQRGLYIPELRLELDNALSLRLLLMHLGQQLRHEGHDLHKHEKDMHKVNHHQSVLS